MFDDLFSGRLVLELKSYSVSLKISLFLMCLISSPYSYGKDYRRQRCYQNLASVSYHLDRTASEKRSRRGTLAVEMSAGAVFGAVTVVGLGWVSDRFTEYRARAKIKQLAKRNIRVSMELIRTAYLNQQKQQELRRYRRYLRENFNCLFSSEQLANVIVRNTKNGLICQHLTERDLYPYYSTSFNLYAQLVPDHVSLFYRDYLSFGSVDSFEDSKYSDLKITDLIMLSCKRPEIPKKMVKK